MRFGTTRFPGLTGGTTVAMSTVAFLALGFVLDLATTQELVVAIVYNVPIALSGLSPSKRLLFYTTAAALILNLGAGVLNALGGVDTVSILNRVIAALSYLLVSFMTTALRRSATRVAALQASEAKAEREHALHDLVEALAGALRPSALLENATTVLRQQFSADAVVISGFEGTRFSAPQFSDPPQAAPTQAQSGSQLPWLAILARSHDPPVAAGLDDSRQLLVGLIEQPQTWAILVVGAKTPGADLYLGEVLRDLGNLLERADLLTSLERQRTELTRRNGVIRDLVYAFSHDLRTPLIANAMNMRLALEGAYGPLEADYQRVLQNGLSANEDLLELADSLLLVARLESGENLSAPEATDLRVLLGQTLARTEPVSRARDVTIRLDAPTELRLLGRATELRRMMQNLLDNAIKFSPNGGTVCIELRRDDTDLSAQGAFLSVSDDGPGVAEAVLPRLFERFSHGRAGGGSGLGLYLAKQIVVGHGGRLDYTPTAGGGSCFTVWLPLAPEAVTA